MFLSRGDTVNIFWLEDVVYGGRCSQNDKYIPLWFGKAILLDTQIKEGSHINDNIYIKTSITKGTNGKSFFISDDIKILPCRMVLVEKNIMPSSTQSNDRVHQALIVLKEELISLTITIDGNNRR